MPSQAKTQGTVYSPEHIAQSILNQAGLINPQTLVTATICEPASRDGATLVLLVQRIIEFLPICHAIPTLERTTGFDNNDEAIATCRHRLDDALHQRHPDFHMDWNPVPGDATETAISRQYRDAFTHVIRNPPYVHIQNLYARRNATNGNFPTVGGATDLHIVYFELRTRLLAPNGTLTYITPDSWLTQQYRVDSIVDHHNKAFANITAYTAISTWGVFLSGRLMQSGVRFAIQAGVFSHTYMMGLGVSAVGIVSTVLNARG